MFVCVADDCYNSDSRWKEIGVGLTLNKIGGNCSAQQTGITFTSGVGVLPNCNPAQSPVWNGGRGTLMSCEEGVLGVLDLEVSLLKK